MASIIPHINPLTTKNAQKIEEIAHLGRGPINQIIWSQDGKMVVVASPVGVWFYDATNFNAQPRFFPHHSNVILLALAPDGITLATADWTENIKLWDMPTGKERSVLTGHKGEGIRCLGFSSDGILLASGSIESIQLWDAATGMERGIIKDAGAAALAFSPDRSKISTVLANGVQVWDVQTGKLLNTFSHEGRLTDVAFSPRGNLIASSSGDERTICLWDITKKEAVAILQCIFQDIPDIQVPVMARSITFSPDGTKLAASTGWFVDIFNVETGKLEKTLNPGGGKTLSLAQMEKGWPQVCISGILKQKQKNLF